MIRCIGTFLTFHGHPMALLKTRKGRTLLYPKTENTTMMATQTWMAPEASTSPGITKIKRATSTRKATKTMSKSKREMTKNKIKVTKSRAKTAMARTTKPAAKSRTKRPTEIAL